MRKKIKKKDKLFFIIVGILLIAIIYVIINDIIVGIQMKKTVPTGKSTLKSGPIQIMIPENQRETIDFKGVKITKLASYDITGVVIGMEYYYFGGGANTISPKDLALAWGPVATDRYLGDISVPYETNDRTTRFWPTGELLKDYKDNYNHYMSNNHIIPANNRLKSVLNKIRSGDKVQIQGYLVYCEGDRWTWGPSSLSRTDHDCEIILAESIYILED